MASEPTKPWGVMGDGGAGWGMYATRAEAEARRDDLLRMRDGAVEFFVVKVVP